jgi:hypothetical protein
MDFSAIVQSDPGTCDFAAIYAAGYNELVGVLQTIERRILTLLHDAG